MFARLFERFISGDFHQVAPIIILHHIFSKPGQLVCGDVTQTIGEFFDTGNF